MKMSKEWKSRKLWVFILGLVAGTVVWYLSDESTFNDWKDMLVWMTGIYMGGNGLEHGAKAMQKNGNAAV